MLKPLLLTLLIPLALRAEPLTFKNQGKEVLKLSVEEIQKKAKPVTRPIFELHDDTEKKYQGVSFPELLTSVYGETWKKAEEVLFTCRDGYQPTVPLAEFLKYPSYLTYGIEGGKFVVDNKAQNEKNIDLGPFYLVWDTVTRPELRKQGMGYWPYQVIAVDLVRFKDRFPNLAPPDGSSAQVVKGFLAFRSNCMACHSVNGDGAPKSVELNYPVSVTEYFKEGWLEKWILNPQSIRHNSTMPALGGDEPKKMVKDIVAYLKAMSRNKIAPRPEKTE